LEIVTRTNHLPNCLFSKSNFWYQGSIR